MKNICLCGHFANNRELYDGQTVKTQSIYRALVKKYGDKSINVIDTYNWKKRPFKLFLECVKYSKKCDDIIILPARNGVKIFVPLFNMLKKVYKFKLHYVVIGGWIYSLIKDNHFMKKQMNKINYIYLENHKTIEQLQNIGINNVCQMNNFKNLQQSKYKYNQGSTFKCCIFSRIEEQKGVSDAIEIVNKIDNEGHHNVILDIYGKVADTYQEEFDRLVKGSSKVEYKGAVSPNSSVEIIEKYDLLLFPTLYFTEGIPGTIIDSYFAGVPVLASKWENFDEIVKEQETGFSFQFSNKEDFYNVFTNILNNRKELIRMRKKCLELSNEFTETNSLKILYKNIGE